MIKCAILLSQYKKGYYLLNGIKNGTVWCLEDSFWTNGHLD